MMHPDHMPNLPAGSIASYSAMCLLSHADRNSFAELDNCKSQEDFLCLLILHICEMLLYLASCLRSLV